MPLGLRTNVASLNVQKSVNSTQDSLAASYQKVSSGERITSAADDAAGLAISESMKSKIRSYVVAERNANDAVSMTQTAEGALGEMHDVLGRMRELAMQSSNGTYSATDRDNIQQEFDALRTEMDRIKQSTTFNGVSLMSSTAAPVTFQVGLTADSNDQVAVNFQELDLSGLMSASLAGADSTNALASLQVIDDTIQNISNQRASFGAAMNRLAVVTNNIQTIRLNLTAANSRIRDTDVAQEMSNISSKQVQSQAGVAMLAQANQLSQAVLGLLK
jgi:flagellin